MQYSNTPLWMSHTDHVPYLGRQLFQAEWFGQKVDAAITIEPLAKRIFCITRNEDDLDLRKDFSDFAHQARSVHARRHNVGDQQIYTFLRIADQIQRRLAAFSLDDFVALVTESAGAKILTRIVVRPLST